MTAKHNEFPPLSQTAQRVLLASFNGIDFPKPGWERRFAAAVIREALEQVSPCTDFRSAFHQLNCIADNLRALPPEPPLKKQALDIWDQIEGEVSDQEARIMRTALALIPDPTT